MRELTIYPDAEKAVIQYLLPLLGQHYPGVTIDVHGAGGRHVRVRRVGGVELSPAHDAPTIDVLVWETSEKARMALGHFLWAALKAADGDVAGDAVVLYGSTVLGPRQLPDSADDTQAFCLLTVSLITRAA